MQVRGRRIPEARLVRAFCFQTCLAATRSAEQRLSLATETRATDPVRPGMAPKAGVR